MTRQKSVFSFLWTPGRRRVLLAFEGNADTVAQYLTVKLDSAEEVEGRVVGRGVKIGRHNSRARQRGAFSPILYGVIRDEDEHCRLVGHFQLHPVGRLYIAAWIGLSTLLALALLIAGALRSTPESSAGDALPFILPVLLPFLGLGLAHWQRQRGRPDEYAIRGWLDKLENRRTDKLSKPRQI